MGRYCAKCWSRWATIISYIACTVWLLIVNAPLSLLIPRLHDTTGCQTGCTTGCQTGCITSYQTGYTFLTTGWMFVYTMQPVVQPAAQLNSRLYNRFDTIQPVVQPVVKPVWQPQPAWQLVVSCIQTFNRLSNRIDNRLYSVNGALQFTPGSWNTLSRVHSLFIIYRWKKTTQLLLSCLHTKWRRNFTTQVGKNRIVTRDIVRTVNTPAFGVWVHRP